MTGVEVEIRKKISYWQIANIYHLDMSRAFEGFWAARMVLTIVFSSAAFASFVKVSTFWAPLFGLAVTVLFAYDLFTKNLLKAALHKDLAMRAASLEGEYRALLRRVCEDRDVKDLQFTLASLEARGMDIITDAPYQNNAVAKWAQRCVEKAQGHRASLELTKKEVYFRHFRFFGEAFSLSD